MSDLYADLQALTRVHRAEHGCGAQTYSDGEQLTALTARLRPQRVLELGTGLGYTACCLASGWKAALIDTIEGDHTHVDLARAEIAKRKLDSRITVHYGMFANVLPTIAGIYELVFFDGYIPDRATILMLRDRLRTGGTLVCANLDLAAGSGAMELMNELSDPLYWRREGVLESGATLILTKV
ncbi:MAG: class I SAM-dependent methyltransferase [Deltaproteobacteria bacterium]